METKKAYEIHGEHKEWLNKLSFYEDDLNVLRHRLEEVNNKNTHQEIRIQVEHFQNQFIIQKNELDELKHSIKDHETYVENRIAEHTVADKLKINDHPKERERIQQFEKLFNELRKEYIGFLSKVM